MKCLIISGGFPPSEKLIKQQLADSDMIIGVDGAADILTENGINSNVLIGDFDTAKKINILNQQNSGAEIIRLSTDKNDTDTEAALNLAIERGADSIVMLGALGSRQDHTQANIALLKSALDSGVFAKILDDNNEMFLCEDDMTLHTSIGQTLSILPFGTDTTVTASGLKYPLDELTLIFGTARGISNVVVSSPVIISILKGTALIIISNGSL